MPSRPRFAAVVACFLALPMAVGGRGAALASSDLECWVETDRQVYEPSDVIRMALCVRNPGSEDVGVPVEGSGLTLLLDSVLVPLDNGAPNREPAEVVLAAGETTVFPLWFRLTDLRLDDGEHTATLALEPAVGEPLSATASFRVSSMHRGLKIADIASAPNIWSPGEQVELRGEYRGSTSRPHRPLHGTPAPNLTDWILGDETGEIYVHNSRPAVVGGAEVDVTLHPGWSYGTRVVVRGSIVHQPDGMVTVRPMQVLKWQGDRGAFCVLEVGNPPASSSGGPAVLLRMIFKNDTNAPVRLVHPAGHDHDFVVEKDGREVWRWSRHRWVGQGIDQTTVRDSSAKYGRATLQDGEMGLRMGGRTYRPGAIPPGGIPPDNSLVFVEYWPLVDNDGNPVEPGLYTVYGFITRRVYTYPVTIEVGHPAASGE